MRALLLECIRQYTELVCNDFNLLSLINLEDRSNVSQMIGIHCLKLLIVLLASQSVVFD